MIAPPPILFGGALALGWLLHSVYPLHLLSIAAAWPKLAGMASIVLGLAISAAVTFTFHRARTAISPWRETNHLVQDGPFRYSRNPDYIGQFLVYIGLAATLNSLWPIVMLPLIAMLVQWGVVLREESYLQAKFGLAYQQYKERVPRWIL